MKGGVQMQVKPVVHVAFKRGLLLAGLLGLIMLAGGCPAGGGVGECDANADCDDGIECTADVCNGGVCINNGGGCVPIDVSTASADLVGALDIQSAVTGVTIASPPVVDFTVTTANGTPVTGIGALWTEDHQFVRFTLTKLVPGTNGDPSEWVAYTRETTNDGASDPNYDTGSALVDYGDGTYSFTFVTDVEGVTGVAFEPDLTHRVAGQIGSGESPLEAQNLFLDFGPTGAAVTETRNIFTMSSCNDCHDQLVFHGRRFAAEYCVNCHTPDLAGGEGDMKYLIHRLHAGHAFDVLEIEPEITYPQALNNCRKCHNGEDSATPDADNWRTVPSMDACASCHLTSFTDPPPEGLTLHTGGVQTNNSQCASCHPASGGLAGIEDSHLTLLPTPNNPLRPEGVPAMDYTISSVAVGGGGFPTVTFSITADGELLDLNNLPGEFVDAAGEAFQWPGFLLAWSEPQDGIDTPVDFNNLGRAAAQPVAVSLGALVEAGGVDCSSGTSCIADFSATANAFPAGALMRTLGLQGYFMIDIDGDEVDETPLHTLSAVMTAGGDEVRRQIIDPIKCGDCHEWFEGHGGNRVIGLGMSEQDLEQPTICTLCHVPNLTSSGRSLDPALAAEGEAAVALGNTDTWTWPEDTNNLKDMIHGIHASGIRTAPYEFVRNRSNGLYFDWSEVTFPAENGTRNCLLCHRPGTYQLPLDENVLLTTVRTTATSDGLDNDDFNVVLTARASVPNASDWVNSSTSSTCYYCHDNAAALAHIRINGGTISVADPAFGDFTQRQNATGVETCNVCHGAGKIADVSVVHQLD
jgi:OmcA/MtrC family decaheme c-type cytochrome